MIPTVRAAALLVAGCLLAWCDGLIAPLTPQQTSEAQKTLAGFKTNPRGPFLRIRWYCKDGSVLPPQGTPCRERGGGNQHAELGPAALRLNGWDLHTGTILTGMPYEELFDAAQDHYRLKEIVLEKYLVEVDGGWIYRRAVSYRGARQVEDEEKAGRQFLIKLLADPEWISRHYYLAQQAVDAVPHGVADSTIKRIRNLAAVAAEQDSRFQNVRAKIHSYPGPEDAATVRRYLAERQPSDTVRSTLTELAALLEQQDSRDTWIPKLRAARKFAEGGPAANALDAAIEALQANADKTTLLTRAAALSMAIRDQVMRSKDGRRNLELLDLNNLAQEQAFVMHQPMPDATRSTLLASLRLNLRMAVGAGLLSMRQLTALDGEIDALEKLNPVPAEAYRLSIRYLGRASEWSRATVAQNFGPVAQHYQDVEPLAKGLVDHLLRSSAALMLTNRLEPLLTDADRAVGVKHTVLGASSSAGVVGLNPGVAVGKLGIVAEGSEGDIDPRGIYVIPQTVSDLKPMAGILSLDTGNALSHTQLLAANLGIPNASIPSRLEPDLEKHKGEQVFFAVTPRNVVVLKQIGDLTESERKLWAAQPAAARPRIALDTARLNLNEKRLIPLTQLGAKDSGAIVGPKAANLGQLSSYFPDKVAPGFAIPFGIFAEHISRVLDPSGVPLIQQISTAIKEADRMRESGAEPARINAYIYPKLAQFRKAIETMPLIDSFQKELVAKMQSTFGADGSYGVFVRSDTNAEDLPEFTGAGLNLTVPNVVGTAKILQAVRDVWASPFTERAYDWRSRALKGTDKVFPSVVVMRAVNNDKSGVIATADLETGDQRAITVNVSEGVSAVVDGGVAESLLLLPNGGVRLLQQCRATYRKVCKVDGGFENLPATGSDTVLQPAEIEQVRQLVAEVKAKYPAVPGATPGTTLPWDIEFGFEKGKLGLFQIRPLVRFQELETLQALSGLESTTAVARNVRLGEKPLQ